MTSLFTAAACNQRAEDTRAAAAQLLQIDGDGRDWAAVALFYSAYHRVRGAMLVDPIFNNATLLSRVNVNLTMADRESAHHEGRRSDPAHRLGVNEIVSLLYRNINGHYMALHQASVQVRYGSGLIAPLGDLERRCDLVHQAAADGDLEYAPPS